MAHTEDMKFTQPLSTHNTLNEAADRAAFWAAINGRRFAVKADHIDGWGNKPRWSVVGQR